MMSEILDSIEKNNGMAVEDDFEWTLIEMVII